MRVIGADLVRLALAALLVLCGASGAVAQLSQGCTVSVLNRTVEVNAEGAWVLPNVPANFGPVRARATCVRNGVTVSGESAPFTVPANGVVNFPKIQFGQTTPIPTALVLTAPTTTLTVAGQATQLTVTARYSNNTTKDVTAGSNVTQYTVSNPAIATVSGDGLARAVASGTALIQATHEGASGMAAITVVLAGVDSDGDGIPDEWELAHGMNPNDPTDAQEDFDRDGLTNYQEYLRGTDPRNPDTDGDGLSDGDEVARGTNPLLRDTDGDGISDGLEVLTGSDPLDPNSYNLPAALTSIDVMPTSFTLSYNTIVGEASRQLKVTGHLKDGSLIDLTSTAKQTNYASSDLTVCNFGLPDGRVFAGNDGVCTVTVSNNGFSRAVQVTIKAFSPTALSFVGIPGFANGVDVNGNFAYVAAGSAGLQVVDVADRRAPKIVASRDTPGSANDVKVVGSKAFVADGPSGLQILDISDPLSPTIVGSVDTPGDAQGVAVRGNIAFVADASKGVQVIDVTVLTAPRIIGAVITPGTALAVDANLSLARAVVAAGTQGLFVLDITNLAAPAILGKVTIGDARGVVLTPDGLHALVADLAKSFTTVDISDPAKPVVLASTPLSTGGLLMDTVLSGRFAFGADIFFVNGVPIIDVSNPAMPVPRAILDFRAFRDDNGTGIAVDGAYVYLTAAAGSNSRLYIGQYLALEDTGGVPPTVSIDSPASGDTVIAGEQLTVDVTATDDVAVARVDLLLSNQVASTDTSIPYQFTFTVPTGIATLTVGAIATDLAGNVGAATPVVLNVIPDPLTTVVGTVVDSAGTPVSGATVMTAGSVKGTTDSSGAFSLGGVPTILGTIVVTATASVGGTKLSGASDPVLAIGGGITDVGQIVVRASLLTNGSFESGTVDPGSNYVTIFGTEISGWTVSVQNIDYVGGRFTASDGLRSVDLNGTNGAGAISQSFPTVVGGKYRVRFDMAGNPEGAPTVKAVRVTAGDSTAVFSFDTTGHTPQAMGWQEKTITFTATAAVTTLTFRSETTGCCWGPEIDNVRVEVTDHLDVIVNINALTNNLANPAQVFLAAGTYEVIPIGPSAGGQYEAWSAWATTSCADQAGCPITVPTTFTGFLSHYAVVSSALSAVSVAGTPLNPVAVQPPGNVDYFLVSPPVSRYHVTVPFVYPSPTLALGSARSSTFAVTSSGNVGFAISDTAPGDNRGGVALLVRPIK